MFEIKGDGKYKIKNYCIAYLLFNIRYNLLIYMTVGCLSKKLKTSAEKVLKKQHICLFS